MWYGEEKDQARGYNDNDLERSRWLSLAWKGEEIKLRAANKGLQPAKGPALQRSQVCSGLREGTSNSVLT